jgi:GT2 family glycosyltransferase
VTQRRNPVPPTDYTALSDEILTAFAHLPWLLGGERQEPEELLAALANESARLVEWSDSPKFTLMVRQPEALAELVASCLLQSWPHWRLVVIGAAKSSAVPDDPRIIFATDGASAGAQSDIVAELPASAWLHPQCLGLVARIFATEPTSARVATDCAEWRRQDGVLTIERLKRQPAVFTESLSPTPPLVFFRRYHGSNTIRTVQAIGYAVREFSLATVAANSQPTSSTKVVAIVPFKNAAAMTLRCLEGLERQTLPDGCQLLVQLVDHDSLAAETAQIKSWIAAKRLHHYELASYRGAFNYARLNNWAVRQHNSSADYFWLLNNDVELTQPDSLIAMLQAFAAAPKLAVCGMRLLYPDGQTVQHNGVRIVRKPGGYFCTSHEGGSDGSRVCSSVTFASALVRAEVWRTLGGMDEVYFANAYSDADFCLRAQQQGFGVYFCGNATGVHHESLSRGHADEDLEAVMFSERHAALLAKMACADISARSEELAGKPLRYVWADQANDALKKIAGPWHRLVKSALRR